MKSIILLPMLGCLIHAWETPAKDLIIPLNHSCGQVEFNVNFMRPEIILYSAPLIKNLTLIDKMDPKNPMHVENIDGRFKAESATIDQFHKNICT